jgi:hypothetical protein
MRTYWQLLLVVVIAALAGIRLLEPEYNALQTATDAADFRDALDYPGRAIAAALCDVVFAVGYGLLGIVAFRALGGRSRLATAGVVAIVAGAAFDELENLLVIANIIRRETLTDSWIDAMRIAGVAKWVAILASLALLVALLIFRATRRGRDGPVR